MKKLSILLGMIVGLMAAGAGSLRAQITPTFTKTFTPTLTPTNTWTITPTFFTTPWTQTKTATNTPSNTPTNTPTSTTTFFTTPWTQTKTATSTPSRTPTNTPTNTPTTTSTMPVTLTPTTPTFTITPTWTIPPTPVTDTPTYTPTPGGPVTFIYVNGVGACSAAFGCTILFVQHCRELNLDPGTSYILMRLGAACGCQPSDIMTLRLTMSWDEIVAYYGLDWSTFITDLQARMATLAPEPITPNQIMRAASNDPAQFPISNPDPVMPDTLPQSAPISEVCTSCP